MAALSERFAQDPKAFVAALIEDAWQEPDEEIRGKLALIALELDPRCSDALLILAGIGPWGRDEGIELAEEALDLAEENMGERPFERFVGRFWQAEETRPYLRARCLLVDHLRACGGWAAVEKHLRELVALWPSEHAGLRVLLLRLLLDSNSLDDAEELLKRYPRDASAFWTYGWALISFRREGASASSQSHLQHAMVLNGYAPHYLLERYRLPPNRPFSAEAGTRAEAQVYAHDFLQCWKDTPGALQWLEETRARKA